MYLFCWCLSEFHPSIDLSFAFLLPTTTFHVAGVGWSVQVHSLSGGLSKTSSAAWTNAYFKCSSPSLATLFLCLSLEFCRILRWPKSQFGWRRLRNLCILQLDYVFAYVTLIKYTYYYYYYTRGYNFPIGTTPKKISVSELGVIFWGSPLFLAVFGHSHFRGATTLNFGPISTKLGGTVRAIKKMTQKDNGPGPGRNYGETAIFTLSPKVIFWHKKTLGPNVKPAVSP